MSSALTIPGGKELAAWVDTKELRETVKRAVFPDSTDAEMALYLHDCRRNNVHPMDRLIHPQVRNTNRGRRYVAVTSIDLFRSRAGDTGEHAGTDDAVFVEGAAAPPGASIGVSAATVTVYRLVGGIRCPFTATARWSEYCPPQGQDQMWRKMPHTMLSKCAEALALRKAFPQQLAGIYTADEMEQAGPPKEQSVAVVVDEVKPSPAGVSPGESSVGAAPVPPAAAAPPVKVTDTEDWLGRVLRAVAKNYGLVAPGEHKNAYANWIKTNGKQLGQLVNLFLESRQQEPIGRWTQFPPSDYAELAAWVEERNIKRAGTKGPDPLGDTAVASPPAPPDPEPTPTTPLDVEPLDDDDDEEEEPQPRATTPEPGSLEAMTLKGHLHVTTVLQAMAHATKGERAFVTKHRKNHRYQLVDGAILTRCGLFNTMGSPMAQYMDELAIGTWRTGKPDEVRTPDPALWGKVCAAIYDEANKLRVSTQ